MLRGIGGVGHLVARFGAPEPFEGRPDLEIIWNSFLVKFNLKIKEKETYLRLTGDDQEDEDSLQGIDDISGIPEVIWSSNPGNQVCYPCYTHDDDQL